MIFQNHKLQKYFMNLTKSKGLNVKLVEAVDAPHIDLDMTTESKDAIEEIVAE